MIWEQVTTQIGYHAQALNAPIEPMQLSDNVQPPNNQDGLQVLFRESPKETVILNESNIQIGYPLTENNLKTITKALEYHLPALAKKYHQKQRDQLKKLVLSGVEQRKTSLTTSIQEAEYTLDGLNRQIFELSRNRNLDKHILTLLEKPIIPLNKKILDEYANVKKLVPGLYRSIQFDDRHIRAKTHQVNINVDGEEFNIGILLIELDLSRGQAKIYNLTNTVNGYPHPHVNDNSEICLGNVSAGLTRLLGEFEIYGALELLHKFIHEYNEGDAYQKIQFWNDPDYCEESDEYERCRESGSYGRVCLDCGDDSCPYYENALEECIENMTFENCVMCRDRCSSGLELLQECHEENPQNCMTCSYQTCPFYKDAEGCHEVNSDKCATCNIECKYQGVANETVTT